MAIWTSYLLISCDRNSWSSTRSIDLYFSVYWTFFFAKRMKYDSYADDWITPACCCCCNWVALRTPGDIQTLKYFRWQQRVNRCNQAAKLMPAEKKTTKTSLEKSNKNYLWLAHSYTTYTLEWPETNLVERTWTLFFFFVAIFTRPFRPFHPFHRRVDCVAVFQWNIFNWKTPTFFFSLFDIIADTSSDKCRV